MIYKQILVTRKNFSKGDVNFVDECLLKRVGSRHREEKFKITENKRECCLKMF